MHCSLLLACVMGGLCAAVLWRWFLTVVQPAETVIGDGIFCVHAVYDRCDTMASVVARLKTTQAAEGGRYTDGQCITHSHIYMRRCDCEPSAGHSHASVVKYP